MVIANMLTAVTFVALFQLFFGNIIIGLVESVLIRRIFKYEVNELLIIGANYVSAFIGFLTASFLLDDSKYNLVRTYQEGNFNSALLLYTGVAYILTLIIETPIFYYGIKNADSRLKLDKLIITSLTANTISYIILLIYWKIFT